MLSGYPELSKFVAVNPGKWLTTSFCLAAAGDFEVETGVLFPCSKGQGLDYLEILFGDYRSSTRFAVVQSQLCHMF